MKIILIRHGKTTYVEQHKYCGALDPSLSESGKLALAETPAYACLQEQSVDMLFVSPMRRTVETAELLFGERLQNIPVVPEEGFREIDFGDFEGRSAEDMKEDPAYTAWVNSFCQDLIPGGDFPEQFREDVNYAFASMVETCFSEHPYGPFTVAVVSHGGVIGSILERYGLPQKAWYEWNVPCGGVVVLETDAATWKKDHTCNILFDGGNKPC